MISKILQILGLQPRISKVSVEQFILTAGQKNFGNKIPFEEIFEVVRDVINDLRTRREHALRIRITNF